MPLSTAMPSVVAYLLIGLFLFYWLRKYLSYGIAFLAGLLIMFSIFTVAIAGLSTPDCLSAFFFFVSAYFILEKRNLAWMSFFFLLAILTRVDNVIVCFFIISFLTFSKKWKRITKPQYFLMLAYSGYCLLMYYSAGDTIWLEHFLLFPVFKAY